MVGAPVVARAAARACGCAGIMRRSRSVNPGAHVPMRCPPAARVRKVARMRGPGEARLLASGALLQQLAQASGLLALLVIVTLLARRLDSVAELGAYGLVASLSGYLLVLRNSVASSAVRAMAGAEGDERAAVFVVARRLYALV